MENTNLNDRRSFFGLVICLAFTLFCSSVHAALIDQGITTLDTETNLEWLDLTETLSLTPTDIFAGAGGFTADGWSVASGMDVDQLLVNAGAPSPGSGPAFYGDSSVTDLLLSLLGATVFSSPTLIAGQGWAINSTDVFSAPFYESSAIAGNSVTIGSENIVPISSFPTIGVFLTRSAAPVPLTSSFWLVAPALLWIWLRRREA